MTWSNNMVTRSTLETTHLIRRRKAALAGVGHTGASIARELGVSRNAVNLVIHGRNRSPRIRVAIARACGQPVEALFPQTADAERMERATKLDNVA